MEFQVLLNHSIEAGRAEEMKNSKCIVIFQMIIQEKMNCYYAGTLEEVKSVCMGINVIKTMIFHDALFYCFSFKG